MRKLFTTCLLLCLIALPPSAAPAANSNAAKSPDNAAKNKESSLDGIYFLPADRGEARLLRIAANRFDIRLIGNLGGTVTGIFSGGRGAVNLLYFNGAKRVRCESTSAVINGRLWVGVFQRDQHRSKRFICRTLNTDVFGSAQAGMPHGTIYWDMDKATWTLTPPHDAAHDATIIDNVQILRHPDDKDDRRLVPIFNEKLLPKVATIFRNDGPTGYRDWASWCAVSAGIFVADDWQFENQPKKAGDDAAARKAMIDQTLRVNVGRQHYEQHGDVILAPWSVDLGPVGMIPTKDKAAKLTGEYVAVDNDKLKVTVASPPLTPKKDDVSAAIKHFAFGRKSLEQWEAVFKTLDQNPDDWGVHRRVLNDNCMMGHADWPGYDFWLPLPKGRLARYIVPSTHMFNKDRWPIGHVVVMKKVE